MNIAEKSFEIIQKREDQRFMQRKRDLLTLLSEQLNRFIIENEITEITGDFNFSIFRDTLYTSPFTIPDFNKLLVDTGYEYCLEDTVISLCIPKRISFTNMTIAQETLYNLISKYNREVYEVIQEAKNDSLKIFRKIEKGNFHYSVGFGYYILTIEFPPSSNSKIYYAEINKIMQSQGYARVEFSKSSIQVYLEKPLEKPGS